MVGYEARWNDSQDLCCSADTIKETLKCICSMTSGNGKVYIYQFGNFIDSAKLVKVITITN